MPRKQSANPSSLADREPVANKPSTKPIVMEVEYTNLANPVSVVWRNGDQQIEGKAIALNPRGMVRVNHEGGQSDIPLHCFATWGELTVGASVRIEADDKDDEFNGQVCEIDEFNLRQYGAHKGQIEVLVKVEGVPFAYLPNELTLIGAIEKPDIAAEVESINTELNETEATFVSAGRATLSLYKLLGTKLAIARQEPEIGGYGKWQKWIKERGIEESRAKRAIRIADPKNWSKLEAIAASNGSDVTDFTLTDALNALTEKRVTAPEELPSEEVLLDRDQIAELFRPWGEFKANSGNNAKFFPFTLERLGSQKFFRSLHQAVQWYSEHCVDGNRLDAPKPESNGVSGVVPFVPNPERLAQRLDDKVQVAPMESAAKSMPDLSTKISLNGALVTGTDPNNLEKQNTGFVIEQDGDSLTLDHGAGYVLTDTAKVLEEDEQLPIHPAGILAKSGNDEQYTPERIWKAGLECFDVEAFELDPASHAQSLIPCDRIFTKTEDGLQQDWTAKTLWMNHPYSQNQAFIDKFLSEYEQGKIGAALLLTKSDNRTDWYQTLLTQCVAFCLVRGGLKFVNDANTSGSFFGSTVFYFGAEVDRFYHSYRDYGKVCQVLSPEMFGE